MGAKYIDVWCGRCGERLTAHWEHGWPNYCKAEIGIGAQGLCALYGTNLCAAKDQDHYGKLPKELHPVIKKNSGHQRVFIEWNHEGEFRLCAHCQMAFLNTIGEFFNMPKAVE